MAAVRRSEKVVFDERVVVSRIAEVARVCRANRDHLDRVLGEILDAAIELTGADKGNIQLLEPSNTLVIAAQRGFKDEFLTFFARVEDTSSVCGVALNAGEQIVEADVETSDVFAGTEGLGVMLRAGVRAVQSTPLMGSAGKVVGMISTHFARPHRPAQADLAAVALLAGLAADHLEHAEARRHARWSAEALETLLEILPIPAAIATDPDCRIVRSNSATAKLYHAAPWENISLRGAEQGEGVFVPHFRDGRQLLPGELPLQVAAASGVGVRDVVLDFRLADGQTGAIIASAAPLVDDGGGVIGAVGTFVDVTALQKAQEAQAVLTRELQHRSNNLLAVVQAIAHRSFVGAIDLDDAKGKLELRLQALGRANGLLISATGGGRVGLREIVTAALEPLAARFEIEGAEVWLSPAHVQNLSVALHELGTNAIKYGALSNGKGTIAIGWRTETGEAPQTLIFSWLERGGPLAEIPSREGQGTRLLRSLYKDVDLDYASDGLRCTIRLPLG
jgi:two-component sensor histidine kinase